MQEGPYWYYQDYPVELQIRYYNLLHDADIIYIHNKIDRNYYRGMFEKDIRVMPTLMIEESISHLRASEQNKNIIIGGNFVSWYGGFDSFNVSRYIKEGVDETIEIHAPSMGRKATGEEFLIDRHLPYMEWTDWMNSLANYKVGVHLMPTRAAGTFALNCAYLGIPCIGYKGLDTQDICFPLTTVSPGDLLSARDTLELLFKDDEFYSEASAYAQSGYDNYYSESRFKENFYETFK
jgi:hypothetical protein